MKYLLIIMVALASCSTVHRITNTEHRHSDSTVSKTIDSTSAKVVDSTSVTKIDDTTSDLTIDSAQITVVLSSDTVKKAQNLFTNAQAQMIHDLTKAVAGNQKVKSVTIKISGVKRQTAKKQIYDYTSLKTVTAIHVLKKDTAHLKVDTVQKSVSVHRTNTIVFAIVAFLTIAAICVIKFKLY